MEEADDPLEEENHGEGEVGVEFESHADAVLAEADERHGELKKL